MHGPQGEGFGLLRQTFPLFTGRSGGIRRRVRFTESQALKLGSCFGGGMRKGNVCGACTGALMVLGLLYGYDDPLIQGDKLRANRVNDMMMERFAGRRGSCLCNVILGCDIATPEGVAYALDNNLFTELCPKVVADAVDVLEEIIREIGSEK